MLFTGFQQIFNVFALGYFLLFVSSAQAQEPPSPKTEGLPEIVNLFKKPPHFVQGNDAWKVRGIILLPGHFKEEPTYPQGAVVVGDDLFVSVEESNDSWIFPT